MVLKYSSLIQNHKPYPRSKAIFKLFIILSSCFHLLSPYSLVKIVWKCQWVTALLNGTKEETVVLGPEFLGVRCG